MARLPVAFLMLLLGCSFNTHAQLMVQPEKGLEINKKTAMVLPQNFYNQHLSFFCKKESQLQKFTGLNLFVRMGSKSYVDYLEKKPNASASIYLLHQY